MKRQFTIDDLKNTPAAKNSANKALFSNGASKVSAQPEKTQGRANMEALQALGRLKSGVMNATEKKYSEKLALEQQNGSILWYAFEPLNLRLADKCFYKVDFLVLKSDYTIEVHEVKGGFVQDDSLVKIKVAAAKFPFRFLMVKYVKKQWEIREF